MSNKKMQARFHVCIEKAVCRDRKYNCPLPQKSPCLIKIVHALQRDMGVTVSKISRKQSAEWFLSI